MAAEETEFVTEATPVFDESGTASASREPRQPGRQSPTGAASPQPNTVRPNNTVKPNNPQSSSPSAERDHFLLDDEEDAGAGLGPSLPLGFDDDLFADGEAGFDGADDLDHLGATDAQTRTAALVDARTGQRHDITAVPFLIGRDPSCDLVLSDPQVGAQQAEVVDQFGHLVIRDLGVEGDELLEVNGFSADQVMLEPGDTIRLGEATFKFQPGKVLANRPADTMTAQQTQGSAKSAGKSSLMARLGRQAMFVVPLAVLGYVAYVFVDMYVLAPEPTITPPKAANRAQANNSAKGQQQMPPNGQAPIDGTMKAQEGGIHFTMGKAPDSDQPSQQADSAAKPSTKPSEKKDRAFDYGQIFNGGAGLDAERRDAQRRQAQNENDPAGSATKTSAGRDGASAKQAASQPDRATPRPPVDAPPDPSQLSVNRSTAGSQWPRFGEDTPNNSNTTNRPPAVKQGRGDGANAERPTTTKPSTTKPSHLQDANEAFPDFPDESGFADTPWPEDQGVLEGELLEGELVEDQQDAQPSFAEQVGATSRPKTGFAAEAAVQEKASSGWGQQSNRNQFSDREALARRERSGAQGQVEVPVDVPMKSPRQGANKQGAIKQDTNQRAAQAVTPKTQPPGDWMSQESNRQSGQVDDEPLYDDGSDTFDGFDDPGASGRNNTANNDPFMQMIEERLATLEAEQREKVEAVRGSKKKAADTQSPADQPSSQGMQSGSDERGSMMNNDELGLAMRSSPGAEQGAPINANDMPTPPDDYRPGPGMPLPADRLDKSKPASPFAQTKQLSAEEAEAAARDLVLQAELIYKEDGAKKLLDDLKRLSSHQGVSSRLKTELADQHARIAKLYRLYTAGQKDFALGNKEDAFEHWIAFLNAEKIVIQTGTSLYAAEVRNIVAKEYVNRATQAERSQNWPQAWRYWNAAKKFGKTAMATRKMRDIEARAQRLFDKGIDLEATNPVEARNLWQQVMQMLPEQHALYGQASAKVSWYDQWRY